MVNLLAPWGTAQQQAQGQLEKVTPQRDMYLAIANDATRDPSERLMAKQKADELDRLISSNAVTLQETGKVRQKTQATEALKKAGLQVPATTKQVGALAFDNLTAKPQTTIPEPPVDGGTDPTKTFTTILGGPVQVTRGFSTPEQNAKVGGVKGSDHTKGLAWDIIPPKGTTTTQAAEALAKAGFGTIDEGDHVHVSVNPVQVARGALQGDSQHGFRTLMPSVAPGDLTNAPGITTLDPAFAMSMIPQPRAIPQVNLPNAPQEGAPAPRPALQTMDKAALLAPLEAAIMPKDPATKYDAWDRVAAMLQGAAAGASRADPTQGLGNIILNAGTGAGAGFIAEKKSQKAERKQYDEAVRQAKITLAKAGFDVDVSNIDTGNKNLDRAWQSTEDTRKVKFDNNVRQDSRSVQEILANAGITAQNIESLNLTDRTRANVGIGAMGNVAQAANAANTQQITLNAADAGDAGIDKLLREVGVDTKTGTGLKNPLLPSARATAAAVKANNPAAAVAGLGDELVQTGHYKDVLGDKDAKLVERAIQQKNLPQAGQVVTAALMANLETNPEAVYKLIDELSNLGLPSAALISKKRTRNANSAAK